MSDSDQVQRLAIVGKPMVYVYPDASSSILAPVVQAVNAARALGICQLLSCYRTHGTEKQSFDYIMKSSKKSEDLSLIQAVLKSLALEDEELKAVIRSMPFKGVRNALYLRIDIFCTDHPSQRGKKQAGAKKTKSAKK